MSILINERGEVGCVCSVFSFLSLSLSLIFILYSPPTPHPLLSGETYNAHAARARTRRSLSVAHPHAPTPEYGRSLYPTPGLYGVAQTAKAAAAVGTTRTPRRLFFFQRSPLAVYRLPLSKQL